MTTQQAEELKQAQKKADKFGNFAELNRINKLLFAYNQEQEKAKRQEIEKRREKLMQERADKFCSSVLSAQNSNEL